MVIDLDSKLPRAELRLELPGFESIRLTRRKKLNNWVWGNVLFGGLIGVAVDFATGAAHRFDSTPVDVELRPGDGEHVGQSPPPLPPRLSDADCKDQRHRIFAEATDIQDQKLRLKKLRTAPVCK